MKACLLQDQEKGLKRLGNKDPNWDMALSSRWIRLLCNRWKFVCYEWIKKDWKDQEIKSKIETWHYQVGGWMDQKKDWKD